VSSHSRRTLRKVKSLVMARLRMKYSGLVYGLRGFGADLSEMLSTMLPPLSEGDIEPAGPLGFRRNDDWNWSGSDVDVVGVD